MNADKSSQTFSPDKELYERKEQESQSRASVPTLIISRSLSPHGLYCVL